MLITIRYTFWTIFKVHFRERVKFRNHPLCFGYCLYLHLYHNLCFLSDIDEGRLKVAEKMGATYTVKVTTRDSRALAKNIAAVLKCQPDCSIECSGAEPSIATAIYVCMLRVYTPSTYVICVILFL